MYLQEFKNWLRKETNLTYLEEFENWLEFINDDNFVDKLKEIYIEYNQEKNTFSSKIVSSLRNLVKQKKGLRIYVDYPCKRNQDYSGILTNVDKHGFYLLLDEDDVIETFFKYESFLCFEYEMD